MDGSGPRDDRPSPGRQSARAAQRATKCPHVVTTLAAAVQPEPVCLPNPVQIRWRPSPHWPPQFNRSRYYGAIIGRWTQEDPLGFGGGDPNLARYVGNSPTNFTDPFGLRGEPAGSNGSGCVSVALARSRRCMACHGSGLLLPGALQVPNDQLGLADRIAIGQSAGSPERNAQVMAGLVRVGGTFRTVTGVAVAEAGLATSSTGLGILLAGWGGDQIGTGIGEVIRETSNGSLGSRGGVPL